MIRLLALALLLLVGPAQSQLTTSGVGGGFGHSGGGPAAAAGCSQATTYLARTSGENTTAVTNYICGLVTNGLITGNLTSTGCGTTFDALYIFASQNSTDALLNVCSNTNYNATVSGSVTFTANSGYSGGGGGWIDTGFEPDIAGGNYTQNSAHLSVWILSDSGGTAAAVGTIIVGSDTSIYPNFASAGSSYWRANDNPASNGVVEGAYTGHYLVNRDSASTHQGYRNAVDQGVSDTAISSGSLSNRNILAMGNNNASPGSYTGSEMVVSFGAKMTAGQVSTFCHLTNVYVTAVGGVGAGIC